MSATHAPSAAGLARFRIPAMDCSAEEADIRRVLDPITGIRSLRFQLTSRTLAIEAPPDAVEAAVAAIGKAGYKVLPEGAPSTVQGQGHAHGPSCAHGHDHGHAHGHTHGHDHDHDDHGHAHGAPVGSASAGGWPAGMGRLGWSLALALAAELVDFFAPETLPWKAAGMGVALAAIVLAGLEVYEKGLRALLAGRLNISALMAVAVTGAFLIGQWPEAAMVMALYAIAEAIEALAVDRARNAIRKLMELAPEKAEVQQADGNWRDLPLAEVAVGATVRVRPGGRVPLDGVVTSGSGAVNQAPVTGESIPVDKAAGDPVFAGTISETGALELRVTAAASDSLLARIIHAVEQAQGSRAPTQTFVDRFAAVYTPLVFALAVAVALAMPLLFGWPWLEALYKALVLLVIACPCALVISTPVTVVSGLTAAARRGVLVKGGTHLEGARLLRAVALDKTGTITAGKPMLVDWSAWGGAEREPTGAIAATLSARSDHPVSKAIAGGLARPAGEAGEVEDFQALPGRGVQGRVGGRIFLLGNHRLAEERGQCSPELEVALAAHERRGRTVTLLMGPAGVVGLFAVADTIRDTSRQAIAELKALGVAPVMLSGDNQATADAIAQQAGITDARGNLLPQDKLDAIAALRNRYGATAMVGDGINDAPALAQADIGFAMGGAGTDIAMEAADVVIMNDDLQRVPETIRLSRRTHAVLWQNIGLALGIKAVFFVLAVFGSATMWMAVFADMGASLLVVANGLRLLRRSR